MNFIRLKYFSIQTSVWPLKFTTFQLSTPYIEMRFMLIFTYLKVYMDTQQQSRAASCRPGGVQGGVLGFCVRRTIDDLRGCDRAMGLKLPGKVCVGVDKIVETPRLGQRRPTG